MTKVRFAVMVAALLAPTPVALSQPETTYSVARVIDGDTIALGNGQRVRLVQIDTPEVFFGTECYGPQASAVTRQLLPEGTRVRLTLDAKRSASWPRLDTIRTLLAGGLTVLR